MPEQLTPPVHPNCRCALIDGIWYDAQDARVCPICMLLGASWNLQLDIPMDDKEVARILDEKDLENFRKAIEKDTALADKVIQQVAESAESGIVKQAIDAQAIEKAKRAALIAKNRARLARLKILRTEAKKKMQAAAENAQKALTPESRDVAHEEERVAANEVSAIDSESIVLDGEIDVAQRAGAETLDKAIEREIVKARAAARAAAPIQAGRVVPGLGVTPDALVFETTPVGKVARLVSVNVASGQAYRVIWRGGKYLLQTVGGRTIDSDDDLWWLLLLLALMEKKRRDDLERERLAREAARA